MLKAWFRKVERVNLFDFFQIFVREQRKQDYAGWVVRQTQAWIVSVFSLNSFPKSQMFANTNMFKLFNLLNHALRLSE